VFPFGSIVLALIEAVLEAMREAGM